MDPPFPYIALAVTAILAMPRFGCAVLTFLRSLEDYRNRPRR